jgi:hypothetical protein
MRRYGRNNPINKTTGIVFVLLMLTLSATGYSYSLWSKTLTIQGNISTAGAGAWPKVACVRIMKMLNGSFTDPYTGNDISTPTNLIHVGTQSSPGWPTKFQLVITVKNCGTVDITDAVYDVIENTVEPINWTASKGTVSWVNKTTAGDFVQNFLTWTIGTLVPDEQVTLEIWIQTLPNPTGKYEPTSENQYIEINRGANVTATSELGVLYAQTQEITLTIADEDVPDDPNIAIIKAPTLPYFTPWAEAQIPP